MNNLKNEKGAITILVLVSILFMVSFLITSYIIVSNKVQAQREIINQTKEIYETGKSMEEIYNSYFMEDEIIPIYTNEQYLKIGSNEVVGVERTNKYYTFSETSTYILMDDFEIEEEELPENWTAPEFLFLRMGHGTVYYNGYIATVSYENGTKKIYDGVPKMVLNVADGMIDITNTGYTITYTDPETNEKTVTTEQFTGPYVLTGTTTTNYVRVLSAGMFDITLRDVSITSPNRMCD